MKTISQLTPAETLLIMNGKEATFKQLLKVTLLDLFAKETLKTKEVTLEGQRMAYVISGPNLKISTPLPHEQFFLQPFHADPSREILASTLLKLVASKAIGVSYYRKLVQSSPSLAGIFLQGISSWFKPVLTLTPQGIRLQQLVISEMKVLEETVPDLIHNDPAQAITIMKAIKGNFFLIRGIDFELVKSLERELAGSPAGFASNDSGFADTFLFLMIMNSSTGGGLHQGDGGESFLHDGGNDWGSSGGDTGGDGGGDSGCGGGCGGGD